MLTLSFVNETISGFWQGWCVDREIGEGAHGIVFHASSDNQEAAIKVISIPQNPGEITSFMAEGNNEATTRTYFLEIVNHYIDEVRIMEKLKDEPNVVQIRDYQIVEHEGEIGWDIYIMMELLTPFQDYLSRAETDEALAVKIGKDICAALIACASFQIIHRDIKPENIFVDNRGVFKLGDFGIARRLERKTASLSQKGTYNYMAPEVLRSEGYTENVDLYSLGIVMYRLVNNNRIPFLDPDKQLVTYQERQEAFERRMAGEEIPDPVNASPAMAALIGKACRFDPEERYQTAEEMLRALLRFCEIRENDDRAARHFINSLEKTRAGTKRKIIVLMALILAVMAAAGGGYYQYVNSKRIYEPGKQNFAIEWQDEELKAAVCDALGKSRTDTVMADELYELKELDASNDLEDGEEARYTIEDISDLIHCPNLEKLNLKGNNISDISVLSELTSMKELVIENNQINDIAALSDCKGLALLEAGDNKISDLSPLGTLAGLKNLRVENNRIKDIAALHNLNALELLDIRENQITDLGPLKENKKDLKLYIDIEQFAALTDDMVGLTGVTKLNIEAFKEYVAKRYDVGRLAEMEWLVQLSMEDVQIQDSGFVSSLTELKYLSLCNAGLSELPPVGGLKGLEVLVLRDNEISSVADMPELPALYYLGLCRNKMKDLEGLDKLPVLEELDLHDNEIGDISGIEALTTLWVLDLETNRVTDLEPLRGMDHLTELYLYDNDIADASPIDELMKNGLENDPFEERDRLRFE